MAGPSEDRSGEQAKADPRRPRAVARALAWAKRQADRRHLPLALALVAMLCASPSLWLGLNLDDQLLRIGLSNPPPVPSWSKGPASAFAFFTGEAALNQELKNAGVLPWWTSPGFRIAFFRPLAGLTHWIDFRLWPGHPAIMHLESLLWLGAMVAAATLFFRRFLPVPWVGALAALIFALDDGHGMPAAWIANRNASIAGFFGVLALLAHDSWRRTRSRRSGVLAPLALLAALGGGELGLATGAYLLAYAVCVDEGPWRDRLGSLLPAAAVGGGWALAYWWWGFGASGSGLYVDPSHLGPFLAAVVERGPILLLGQWLDGSDVYVMLSERAAHAMWVAACGLMVLVAVLMAPVVRQSRVARFFALGMLASIPLACGTFPSDRLLVFAGLGGAGLLAMFLAARAERRLPSVRGFAPLAGAAAGVFVVVHLVLAPIGLAAESANVKALGQVAERAAASLPRDPAVAGQQVVVVNAPSFFMAAFGPTLRLLDGGPLPERLVILATGIHPMQVHRAADNVLVIRPAGGFLMPPGAPLPGNQASERPADLGYAQQTLDTLYRDATPFRVGDRVALSGLTVEVTEVTSDGRPAEAAYHFAASLDDRSKRWLRWSDGVYVPFVVPRVGESVEVPAATVSLKSH